MTSSPLGWYMLQRRGEQEVLAALQEKIANLVLIERGYESEIVSEIRALANEQNLVIEEEVKEIFGGCQGQQREMSRNMREFLH